MVSKKSAPYLSAVSASAGCVIPELGGGNSIDARVASMAAWMADDGFDGWFGAVVDFDDESVDVVSWPVFLSKI